jgi:hypothetical protein
MASSGALSIPMLMEDWVLIMEAVNERILAMKNIDSEAMDEDTLADMYTDQENLKGILKQIQIEFLKEYGTLPDLRK